MTKPTGQPTDFESFLTWEALTDVLSYDPQTGEFRWVWSARPGWVGRVAGHVSKEHGYRTLRIAGRKYLTSRLAWLHETKQWPSGFVDHINGERADDRWENLRDTTPAENALNKARNRNNATGVSGVYWDGEREAYIARLAVGGERKYLGSFNTIAEASAARQAAETVHYGQYRRVEDTHPVEAVVPKIKLAKTPAQRGIASDVASGLNQAMLIRIVSYDPATGEFRWLEANHGEVKVGPVAGKTNKKGYRVLGIGGCTFYAHRLAWLYMTGEWPAEGMMIDHEDGNPSNNQWSNLRLATHSQNNVNRVGNPGPSGIIGVLWRRDTGKWMAGAYVNNKRVHLGTFDTIEEAAKVRAVFDEEQRGGFRARNKSSSNAKSEPNDTSDQALAKVECLGIRR